MVRYMERPIEMHVVVVKRIMRYLQGTLDLGIWFKHKEKNNLQLLGWTYSDYVGDKDEKIPQGMYSRQT